MAGGGERGRTVFHDDCFRNFCARRGKMDRVYATGGSLQEGAVSVYLAPAPAAWPLFSRKARHADSVVPGQTARHLARGKLTARRPAPPPVCFPALSPATAPRTDDHYSDA